MSETPSMQTRKPRPAGPRQCPKCHRDLWEPCLQCRQTGLQQPTIVWCPECGQPGRGEYCRKCGAKLHAPPVCTKCDGLGWLPIYHECLPEAQVGAIPPAQQQEPAGRSREALRADVPEEPGGQEVRPVVPRHVPASPPPVSGEEDDGREPSRRIGCVGAVFVIILIVLFFCYVSICGYTGY
jgi:hypothetical protein